jgi:redox-sensitive bicupin YhaK (pirin superfamily)
VTISAGATELLDADEAYSLVMVVEGRLSAGGVDLAAEQAALLPPAMHFSLASADPKQRLVLLLAKPR